MLLPSIFLYFYLSQVNAWSTNTNYCSPDLCVGRLHIACQNNGSLSSQCQSDAKVQKLSSETICKILGIHNELRNRVANGDVKPYKPAARMAKMRWMPDLESLATLKVNTCSKRFDTCSNLNILPYVGQTIAFSSWISKPTPVEEVILDSLNRWSDEQFLGSVENIEKYNPPKNQSFGRFAQMVQEAATHVGCAVLRQTKDRMIEQLMVCNYAKANVRGQAVYKTSSKPASDCKKGRDPLYKQLCSVKEPYNWGDEDEDENHDGEEL